jgi:hypothetical protein
MMERAASYGTGSSIRSPWLVPCLLWLMICCGVARAQDPAPATATCENLTVPAVLSAENSSASITAVSPALQKKMEAVRAASFSELQRKVVNTRNFESSADYFRTRFSVSRFLLLRPMHYFVEMNPRIENAGPSEGGVCGILAHELVHILRMSQGNRIRLFGFVRLLSGRYTARFERSADLEAIRCGYGPGLTTFREWVYQNIPPAELKRKKRNYFSPEEISAILEMTRTKPELFAYWNKHVPLNLQQIERASSTYH